MRMNDDVDERVDSIMAQQNLVVCNKCGGVNRLPPARYAIGGEMRSVWDQAFFGAS